jgi:hypothetical protein
MGTAATIHDRTTVLHELHSDHVNEWSGVRVLPNLCRAPRKRSETDLPVGETDQPRASCRLTPAQCAGDIHRRTIERAWVQGTPIDIALCLETRTPVESRAYPDIGAPHLIGSVSTRSALIGPCDRVRRRPTWCADQPRMSIVTTFVPALGG